MNTLFTEAYIKRPAAISESVSLSDTMTTAAFKNAEGELPAEEMKKIIKMITPNAAETMAKGRESEMAPAAKPIPLSESAAMAEPTFEFNKENMKSTAAAIESKPTNKTMGLLKKEEMCSDGVRTGESG